MKYIFTFVFGFSCFVFAAAQTPATPSTLVKDDKLKLKETEFDFGKIAQGKPVTHIFEVINIGNEMLVLENVQASCGCTTPEWSKEPIAPGATQQITVGYNAAAEGPFEKSITVFYNKGQIKTIQIKGNVWKTPDQSAPKNNSLTIFKN
jgi:Protein of unknown function (DUF1573)